MLAAILEKKNFTYFHISDHIWDTPVKFGWNIPNGSEVITISFWGSKKTPKWPSCDFLEYDLRVLKWIKDGLYMEIKPISDLACYSHIAPLVPLLTLRLDTTQQ